MAKQDDDEIIRKRHLRLGYGGLKAPQKPLPLSEPSDTVEFTDSQIEYGDILTDSAGIPLLPKKERKMRLPSAQPLIPEEILESSNRETILINGVRIWSSVAKKQLKQWYRVEVIEKENSFFECVTLLMSMYYLVNNESFPQWASDHLESIHSDPNTPITGV